MIKRIAYYDLICWCRDPSRKPLLLRGARQVGKTHLVRELGKEFPHYIEINFEKSKKLAKVFEDDLDPKKIIRQLSLITDDLITPGKTLLFLDEIQEVPKAIIALRYFYEEMPELHVIAAGSLLEFAIQKVGVPVGRISFLYVYPISFIEFLYASSRKLLAKEILHHKVNTPISDVTHQELLALLGEYLAIGGMPKVVSDWVTLKDIAEIRKLQNEIVSAYQSDFLKYTKKHETKYVDMIFRKVPAYICRRFKYSQISSEYRKRELEPALQLLEMAGVLHVIYHTHANGRPLGTEVDFNKYKVIMNDIALTQAALGGNFKDFFLDAKDAIVNKGEIAEAFVGQELLAYSELTQESKLYYWLREKRNSNAEVDYLFEIGKAIIPIEVKSGHGSQLQSIRVYLDQRKNTPYGIRFSIHNYSVFDSIHSYPLYAVASAIGMSDRLRWFLED